MLNFASMKKIFILSFMLLCGSLGFGQKKQAYQIFNAKGKKSSYSKMINSLTKQDVILFGELHNNPISHWLQLEVTTDLN